MAKRALVCGAGGFIGGHLVRRLAEEGCWVRGVDAVERPYGPADGDEYVVADLRDRDSCVAALQGGFDEVYQLAADMGGMEFIASAACEIMHNNALINLNLVDTAARGEVGRYFFASSVCVYRDMGRDEQVMSEDGAYPASPDNEYGWEKLYSERLLLSYARQFGLDARIGRFQNCYGPEGAWRGGREKAPAAICRKVAEAVDGDAIDVFGGGRTTRQFVYVDDLVTAVTMLARSDETRPTNIGSDEQLTINEVVGAVARVAGKRIRTRPAPGPLGVESRNFSHDRIQALGWRATHSFEDGIAKTYPWIAEQVRASRRG